MEKPYESLVVEVRPRLQSINVFISFVMVPSDQIRVAINENTIEILDKNNTICTIPLTNLTLRMNSLSSLRVDTSFVSFRIATENKTNTGSFKAELLQNNLEPNLNIQKNVFLKDVNYSLQCSNCTKTLKKSNINFSRVLPLPSENSEPGDWFCHAHNSNEKLNLDPSETDLFYSHSYVHLNKNNLNHIISNSKMFVCRYCLNWLGVVHNQNTLKVWCHTVRFLSSTSSLCTKPLSDIFITFKELLKNSLLNSVKVILKCIVSERESNCLLVWLLETKLNLLINVEDELKNKDVAKVLFKFIENEDVTLNFWQQDQTINTVLISKPMMLAVLKHLYEFNKVFPKQFRKSNDFNISYLMMYD